MAIRFQYPRSVFRFAPTYQPALFGYAFIAARLWLHDLDRIDSRALVIDEAPCRTFSSVIRSTTGDLKQGTSSMTGTDLHRMLPGMLQRLWVFALRISGDRHDAEDLVQRACVRALERSDQLRPDTSPLSWMFSIVHSTWINEVRARSVRSRSGVEWDDSFLETVADPSARTPETNVMNGQIVSAVERLPEAQRAVMLLVAVEGLTYKEAAEVLGVPIGTVMSRLARARETIGARFGVQEDNKMKTGVRSQGSKS